MLAYILALSEIVQINMTISLYVIWHVLGDYNCEYNICECCVNQTAVTLNTQYIRGEWSLVKPGTWEYDGDVSMMPPRIQAG